MKRILIAGVIGGIVLFVWGTVSWMFLPWHIMGKLPDESSIAQSMSNAGVESGVYHMPGIDREAEMTDEERDAADEAFKTAHEEGPLAFIVYKADGGSPMPIMSFVMGFILDVILAIVAAALLAMAAPALPGLPGRVFFVMMLGVFASFATHLMNWNWMNYPLRFSLEMAADTVVSALLLGIALAIVVRPSGGMGDELGDFEVTAGP